MSDHAEVVTHHTDPLDTDSDNDGYTDLDEVLYGGNPNDQFRTAAATHQLQPDLRGQPEPLGLDYASAERHSLGGQYVGYAFGNRELQIGHRRNSQTSVVRFRGDLRPGAMTFWAKVDAELLQSHDVSLNGVNQVYLIRHAVVPVHVQVPSASMRSSGDSRGTTTVDSRPTRPGSMT